MAFLEWRAVSRDYGNGRGLDGFSLTVQEGEVVAVLGPSGSGKSTLLRVTAGLERPDAGAVLLEGRDLADTAPHQRGFGLMFQDYCLFPHLTVAGNVAFGLRMNRMPRGGVRERVREMLRLVRLEGFEGRDVISLSGGEQQRVALARSLAPQPRLLMLDEPLGALDPELRSSLLAELMGIIRAVGVTALYVTHDHAEAMTAASRVALMDRGRIAQAATPEALVQSPADAFVASFLGLGALLPRGGSVLLVRPAQLSLTPVAGWLEVRARLESRTVRAAGTSLRVALLDDQGAAHPLEVEQPTGAPPPRWMEGLGRAWVDAARCAALPPPTRR
jgi:ABC-type Fe3+/spermidine/putrescine transport system ATPase subunit